MLKTFIYSLFLPIAVYFTNCAAWAGEKWSTNHLAGSGRDPLPYLAEPFLPDLVHAKPVDIEFIPGISGIVVVELPGKIWAFEEDSVERRLVVDFTSTPGVRLYNIEFHPDFPNTPRAWLAHNQRKDGKGFNTIYELNASVENGIFAIAEEKVELLSWQTTGHDGCDLKYNPDDGCLYISSGDGEAPADPSNVGQKTDNLLGSILRIDVSDPDKPLQIPTDNPFINENDVPDAVWAYGLRNPWRMSFRPETRELFLGDNGDENWELVRKVERATNHGWSAFEGSVPFRLTNQLEGPVKKLTIPVYEHPHTEMRSIIGGFFYRGKALPELIGHYIYGCYFTGKIWALEWDGEKPDNVRRICDLGGPLVSFAEDRNHELIMIDHNGPIYRLVRNPEPPSEKPTPPTLSETGLFSDTENLTPSPGVIPYEIAAPAWQDGGEVTRHFGVAASGNETIEVTIGERQNKSWRFPNGSAFAQTIAFGGKRSETRVIHKDGGEWQFFTYHWRDNQTDADLVPPEGLTNQPCSIDKQTLFDRRIPSRAECTACHTQRSFFVLGLTTEQLNIPVQRDGKSVNQLDWLTSNYSDLFRPNQVNDKWQTNRPPALPNPHHPESGDLDARARTYLHVNCAHCHRESGLGGRAQFELLSWLGLEETGTINTTPLVGLPGIRNPKIISPGKPEQSEIFRRMSIRGAAQMPLLDSSRIDEAGVSLIEAWISSLAE